MTLATSKKRVAENLGILTSDGTTIRDSNVTAQGIENRLNDIWTEELFPLLSDKFPDDFKQFTYPQPTYTISGVVDASSSGTTLVSTSPIFDNTMEGFYIQESTGLTKAKIATYVSTTQVTLESSVSWDGYSIYVLGNEFAFGGNATDLNEILDVGIKYSVSDTYFRQAESRVMEDVIRVGNEAFSTSTPIWYPTTLNVGGIMTKGIGILPYPTDYRGKYVMSYTGRAIPLTTNAEPILRNAGVSQCMINGATAWGKGIQRLWKDASWYMSLYENSKKELIKHYRPRNRSGATKVRWSNMMESFHRRRF